jgi:hypothetical protein
MVERHAMLVIARAAYDVVVIPGREPLTVPPGAGEEAARTWWSENEEPAAAQIVDQDTESWQKKLADWEARTKVEFGKDRLYEGGPRVDVARIKFPDNSKSVVPLDTAEEYMVETFRSRHALASVESQFALWRQTVQLTEIRNWIGQLYKGNESLPMEMGVPASRLDYPIGEVLSCLDRLSVDGWQVVHVSEDRGSYFGTDAASGSAVATVRYLLTQAR